MRFAIVEGGVVINVAVADEPLEPTWIASDEAGPGWSFDGQDFWPPAEPEPDMPALRKAAFDRAMAAGNRITAAVTGTYSDAEARTWAIQEEEARIVVAGASLPAWALLPGLAADKGETLQVYAARVVERADTFKAIARAGVRLRRAAEGLLSPTLDTPAKLDAAIEALRAAAADEAAKFGLPPP